MDAEGERAQPQREVLLTAPTPFICTTVHNLHSSSVTHCVRCALPQSLRLISIAIFSFELLLLVVVEVEVEVRVTSLNPSLEGVVRGVAAAVVDCIVDASDFVCALLSPFSRVLNSLLLPPRMT